MIKFELRRRKEWPKRGDKFWKEYSSRTRPKDKPHAMGCNGFIARIDWQEKLIIVVYDDGKTEEYQLWEIRNCWTDNSGGMYIIESEEEHETINGFTDPSIPNLTGES